ncbi:MAG: YchF/TatD family DNA exonuclease [bacterium]|nr:MAG: YchF/TatD family DNA exonuclease [bacterium]
MLIDSHAHLTMPQFAADLDAVIDRANGCGVGEVLDIGYDRAGMDETLALADGYGSVYASLGLHPHEARNYDDGFEDELKKNIMRRKVLAVGEVGLDYYRDLSPRDIQRDVFRRQIGLALYFGKPIVVHSRQAFEDVVRILEEEGAKEVGGIVHAFSGSLEEARRVIDLGFLIGIGGPVTYRKSKLPDVVSRLPSNAFVLETDCPYLPPEPYRGKRNEPAYVRLVAEKVAGILGVTIEDIERAAEVNYRYLLHGERDIPPRIAYELKGNIYVNVTGSCTNNCRFCVRLRRSNFLYGYNLNLVTDPTVDEMVAAVRELATGDQHREIVFCGYGEPTCRLHDILAVARRLSDLGLPFRINTNGHGNLINRRNIVPELEGAVQKVSVSLNAPDRDTYMHLCRPDAGVRAFDSLIDFIRKASASALDCEVTALDCPEIDTDRCRTLVEGIPGARFRTRKFHFNTCED